MLWAAFPIPILRLHACTDHESACAHDTHGISLSHASPAVAEAWAEEAGQMMKRREEAGQMMKSVLTWMRTRPFKHTDAEFLLSTRIQVPNAPHIAVGSRCYFNTDTMRAILHPPLRPAKDQHKPLNVTGGAADRCALAAVFFSKTGISSSCTSPLGGRGGGADRCREIGEREQDRQKYVKERKMANLYWDETDVKKLSDYSLHVLIVFAGCKEPCGFQDVHSGLRQ